MLGAKREISWCSTSSRVETMLPTDANKQANDQAIGSTVTSGISSAAAVKAAVGSFPVQSRQASAIFHLKLVVPNLAFFLQINIAQSACAGWYRHHPPPSSSLLLLFLLLWPHPKRAPIARGNMLIQLQTSKVIPTAYHPIPSMFLWVGGGISAIFESHKQHVGCTKGLDHRSRIVNHSITDGLPQGPTDGCAKARRNYFMKQLR